MCSFRPLTTRVHCGATCTTTDSNPISGMVLDSALNRISDAEAQAIIQADATPTPSPTAEPPQQQGYAVARGDNVYMRTLPSELSGISRVLSARVKWPM